MDLVTVTCDRDYNYSLLQAESIQKFLTPCTHWVVINERNVDIEKWYAALRPFYKNHTLNILLLDRDFADVEKLPLDGWDRQQLIKLKVSKFLKDDYLILDTKCFFIKPTDLNEWEDTLGDGDLYGLYDSDTTFSKHWKDLSEIYAKRLKCEPLPSTLFFVPFKIKIKPLHEFAYMHNLEKYLLIPREKRIKWDKEEKRAPSEFIFYSYLVKDMLKDIKHISRNYHYFTRRNGFGLDRQQFFNNIQQELQDIENNREMKITAFHPHLVDDLDNVELSYINQWLSKIGINFKF